MSDYETVKAMRDANWKPAVTYWKEKCDQADATIARLSEQVNTLITEKHADAEAIGALRDALAEVTAERDALRVENERLGFSPCNPTQRITPMTTNPLRDQIEALFGYCKGGPDGGWPLAKGDLISRKEVLAILDTHSEQPAPAPFQSRVQPWMMACFGAEISADRLERGDRLLEEVLELLQSGGYPRERIAALSSYVWSRPEGEPAQEVGGVMVTLAAYCLAHGLDMHEAGETELARIWTRVEKIRAKQAAKPTGSALPQAWPAQPSPDAVSKAWQPTHQHVKRGTEYRHIGTARIQSDVPLDDYSEVEVYIGAEGDLWARRKVEFHDGRFHTLAGNCRRCEACELRRESMDLGGDEPARCAMQ